MKAPPAPRSSPRSAPPARAPCQVLHPPLRQQPGPGLREDNTPPSQKTTTKARPSGTSLSVRSPDRCVVAASLSICTLISAASSSSRAASCAAAAAFNAAFSAAFATGALFGRPPGVFARGGVRVRGRLLVDPFLPGGGRRGGARSSPAEFIILNTKCLVFATKCLVFTTQFLVCNSKIIIFTHLSTDQRRPSL